MNNKQPYHSDSRPASRFMRVPLVFVLAKDSGNDKVTGSHTDSTSDQDWFAA